MAGHRICVEGFEPFQAEAGSKLAYVIEQAGVDISHRCGGNARCTTCRVQFMTEEPPMAEKERDCLEEDGVLGQFRLSCQIRVDRDMDVKVLMRASEQGWDPGIELEP
ncbi:MAG: Na(+)-translocating NADH-quinone reductase subunit F [Fimbriimonadaceae bacterium]|nr:Na(+)-translocating NADH-quinone reductase subunit F [Fimbriimonadaceae bacterium]